MLDIARGMSPGCAQLAAIDLFHTSDDRDLGIALHLLDHDVENAGVVNEGVGVHQEEMARRGARQHHVQRTAMGLKPCFARLGLALDQVYPGGGTKVVSAGIG